MAAKWKEYKNKAEGQGSGKSKSKDIVCFNCDRPGHIKADCWREGGGKADEKGAPSRGKDHKRGNRGKKGGDAKSANDNTQNTQDYAFAAIAPGLALRSSSNPTTVVRLLDTAASHHYDPNKSNFVTLEPCEPYAIEIADGKVLNATSPSQTSTTHHGYQIRSFLLLVYAKMEPHSQMLSPASLHFETRREM